MKLHTKLFVISATLITFNLMSGCGQSSELPSAIKIKGVVAAEVKDGEVTARVKKVLLLDDKIKHLNIAVATLKGDVKLIGFVDSQSQIDYLDKLVRNVEGVHTIHSELSIKE